jgi:hypothetical protein
MIDKLLTHQYTAAVLIPILLIICGAFSKKLVRGTEWKRSDFFMGIDLTLAALASSLINASELLHANQQNLSLAKVVTNTSYIPIAFFIFFIVLCTHQDWEQKPQNKIGQWLWLGVFCNLIGTVLMVSFIVIVKGIS